MLSHELDIETFLDFQALQMHIENLDSFLKFRKIHMNLSVESTCSEQCLVQNVSPVGSSKNDDT